MIVARVRWQKEQTRYVYILRSKCGKTPEMLFIKTRAVRNSCSKGSTDRRLECAGRNKQGMCIFFVLNVQHQKCFLKRRAVRNSRECWQKQTICVLNVGNLRNALNRMCVVDNSWLEGEENIAQPGRPKKGARGASAQAKDYLNSNYLS